MRTHAPELATGSVFAVISAALVALAFSSLCSVAAAQTDVWVVHSPAVSDSNEPYPSNAGIAVSHIAHQGFSSAAATGLPVSVALSPNGLFSYVGSDGGGSGSGTALTSYDTETGATAATIDLRAGTPWGIALTPDSAFAYVTLGVRGYNPGHDPPASVAVVDTATDTVATTIPVCAYPVGIAITPDGSQAYVANEDCGVVVIDTATNTVLTTIAVGPYPRHVAIAPDGSRAYVTNSGSSTVSVIDTALQSVVATIGVEPRPDDIVISPDGLFAYVTQLSETLDSCLSVISTVAGAVDEVFHYLPANLLAVDITPDGSYLMLLSGGAYWIWKGHYTLLQSAAVGVFDVRDENYRPLVAQFNLGAPPITRAGDIASALVGPCGNGQVDAPEECDDGNLFSADGCDTNCTVTSCGNGIVTAGETCDDGNLSDGDGCDSDCTATGCGNGVVTAGEDCDDGNLTSGDGCDSNCRATGCGNGVVTAGEACDDGNFSDGDGCDSDCTVTGCGNGILTAGEECDDGNLADGDGCDSNCTVTDCGNGITTAGEECDDGNLTGGDGCDSDCSVTGCGNGIVTEGEECDDGNDQPLDGCTPACAIEYLAEAAGPSRSDCIHEWLVPGATASDRDGVATTPVTCVDDSAGCDHGAAVGDNVCTFRLSLCFNVRETRFACSATDVQEVRVMTPRLRIHPHDAMDAGNRIALDDAMLQLGTTLDGQCMNSGSRLAQPCISNDGCDSMPASGDGLCTGIAVFEPPLSEPNACAQLVEIKVPVRQTAGGPQPGKKQIRLAARPSADPVTGASRPKDTDKLKLICQPRT